jgi:hypothetical protein
MLSVPNVNPGLYPGGGQASILRANEQQWLFQNQLVKAGQSSIAVQLERIKGAQAYPNGMSVQAFFTNSTGLTPANPGAFELDLQNSDVDVDIAYYQGSALTSLNTNYIGGIALNLFWAKFARVNLVSITNPVYLSVLVSR